MFGYVVAHQPGLKEEELDIYKGYYCGLCRVLRKRHGISGQLTLTYDMTFLSILLSSLYDPQLTDETHRCMAHPLHQRRMISSKYTTYVADMNVLLSYYKARDDWQDDRSILKLAFSKLIHNRGQNYREKSDAIAALLEELRQHEQANETNIDTMAGIFGRIMAILFVPKQDVWSDTLAQMGFFLGKFIYILDAYDDLEEDLRKHRYNPFTTICNASDFDGQVRSMLTMMMAECSKAFEMLPILENAEILRNILYAGVWSVFYRRQTGQNGDKNE